MKKQVYIENLPAILKKYEQWVLWKLEKRGGKHTKIPYQINGKKAKSNDPDTWSGFDNIVAKYQEGSYSGKSIPNAQLSENLLDTEFKEKNNLCLSEFNN